MDNITVFVCLSLTSAVVGWMPISLSKSAFVAPMLIMPAKPWVTSPAFGPR